MIECVFFSHSKTAAVSDFKGLTDDAWKGFRNVLVHRYAHVADDIVHYNLINHLDDFYEFKSVIESYLEKHEH